MIFISTLSSSNDIFEQCRQGKLSEIKNTDAAQIRQRDENGRTILHEAARYGHIDIINYILDQSIFRLDVTDDMSSTPLHEAAYYGQLEVINSFLNDYDINIQNAFGYTLFHLAALGGHAEIVHHFYRQGADFNIRSIQSENILHFSAQSGDSNTIDFICFISNRDYQCDISIHDADAQGRIPLDYLRNRHGLAFNLLSGRLETIYEGTETVGCTCPTSY